MNHELKQGPCTNEEWREYDFAGRVYRIDSPVVVVYRSNGATHRVVDRHGIVHCVPAPGVAGCVLRWKAKRGEGFAITW